MKKKERIISILLSTLILGLNFNVNTVKAESINEGTNNATGYITSKDEKLFTSGIDSNSLSKSYNEKEYSRLPSRYSALDYDEITGIKNQKNLGCCWAFASYAAIEANLKKNTGEDYDFSEIHMAANESDDVSDYGGNYYNAFAYFLKGNGPVLEKESPYPWNGEATSVNINKNAKVDYRVNEMYYLHNFGSKEDTDYIKKGILDYGALACNVRISASGCLSDNEKYLYDANESENPDHGVTIVGWDDTISKDNFKNKPEGDGAFICKNSWGEHHDENGFVYVSYYDVQIRKVIAAYDDIEKLSPYEKSVTYSNYNELDMEYESDREIKHYGTVFQADEDINLNSISMESLYVGANYRVYVEEDFNANGFSKIEGKKKAEIETQNSGGHIIKLDKPVKIEKGKRYFVCIESNEMTVLSGDGDAKGKDCNYICKNGEWEKCERYFPITANTSKVLANEVKSISLDKSSVKLNGGETCKLNINFNPSNATDKTVNWRTSDKDIVSVNEDGVVKAKRNGQAVITAYTELGNVKASCTINVKNSFNATAVTPYREDEVLKEGKDLKVVFNDFVKVGTSHPYFIDEDGNKYECSYKLNDNNIDIKIKYSDSYAGKKLKLIIPKDSFVNESGEQLENEKSFTFKKPLHKAVSKIEFKDKKFEKIIRNELGKFTGDILPKDMSEIKILQINDEDVWNISELEYAENLIELTIGKSNIYSLESIEDLKHIVKLEVQGSNISSLEPLRNKKGLTSLTIQDAKLSDYSALSTLVNLEELSLNHTFINNIDFVTNMSNLGDLYLNNNEISDISALRNLTKLSYIKLTDNQIRDIKPLYEACLKFDGEYPEYRTVDVDYNLIGNSKDTEGNSIINKIEGLNINIYNDSPKEDLNIKYVNGATYSFSYGFDDIKGSVNDLVRIDFSMDITNKVNEKYIYIDDYKNEKKIFFDVTVDKNVLYLSPKEEISDLDCNYITFDENAVEGLSQMEIELKPYSDSRCDINTDGKVDVEDLAIVARDYNKGVSTANSWDINEDIIKDGIIDIYDIAVVSRKIK